MSRATLFLFVASGFALSSTPPCRAQEDLARRHIETGLVLAARGDTAGALTEFQAAVDAKQTLAEKHFQLGRLLARKASTIETDFQERAAAARSLRKALFLEPDNPAYLAEYGFLLMKQLMRNDGERVLRRALRAAEQHGVDDPALISQIYFTLGWIQDVRYERQRDRRLIPPTRGDISTSLPMTSWLTDYVDGYLENAPRIEDSGQETRARMIEHYWAALEHDPVHLEATKRLLVPLIEEGRTSECLSLLTRLARALPDRPEASLYRGLVLHVAGREEQAEAAFEDALARLPEYERDALLDLGPILRKDRAEAYAALDDTTRARSERAYWRLNDPIYLTETNERRLEHLARVAYADLRFSEPATGVRGWETDRGVIFIRYGPPTEIANTGGTIVWRYGRKGPVFMFKLQPTYRDARFARDYRWIADEYRHMQPAVYGNIPSIASFTQMPMQIARFRGDAPDWIAVEIHTEVPLERLSENLDLEAGSIDSGIFLRNWHGDEITESVRSEVLHYTQAAASSPFRCWRIHLPAAGELIVGVEARDPLSWRVAVARDVFQADYFPADSLAVSDILLADHIRLRAIVPKQRSHFNITPNAAREYVRNQRLWLYYEIYGLQKDTEGFGAYDITLTLRVRALADEDKANLVGLLSALAKTWGFSLAGDDRIELEFGRDVDLKGRDRVAEHYYIDLAATPAGEYSITLHVWDRIGRRFATSSRTFTVSAPK